MLRKSRISTAVLALSITLGLIPITARQDAGQLNVRQGQVNNSQPPVPSVGESQGNQPTQQPQPTQEQSDVLVGPERAPAAIRIVKSQEESNQEQTDRQRQATSQWWTIGLTGAIAFFTLALVGVGWIQRRTYEAQLATTQAIERAYVDISHDQSGLTFEGFTPRVRVGIRNHGSTPGEVVSLILRTGYFGEDDPLPDKPDYGTNPVRDTSAFLMPTEAVWHTHTFDAVPPDVFELIQSGKKQLVLIACVDYLDRFGRRHRHGYARQYNPKASGAENLFVVLKRGYNYDIEVDESGNPK